MKKQRSDFDIALPLSVNADHQSVEVYHDDPPEQPVQED